MSASCIMDESVQLILGWNMNSSSSSFEFINTFFQSLKSRGEKIASLCSFHYCNYRQFILNRMTYLFFDAGENFIIFSLFSLSRSSILILCTGRATTPAIHYTFYVGKLPTCVTCVRVKELSDPTLSV